MIQLLVLTGSFYAALLPATTLATQAAVVSPSSLKDQESIPQWELFDSHNGIDLYRKKIPESPLLAYKGVGVIQAPMAKVVTAILDTPRRPEWMSRIQQAKVLRHFTPDERIEYIHVATPWPLSDRDFVYRTRVEYLVESQSVLIHFVSTEFPNYGEFEDKIRALVHPSVFKLTALNGGSSTRVEAEAHSDPRGLIPHWIVNLYQKRLPRESLEGLLHQVKKADVLPNARVRLMLTSNLDHELDPLPDR